MNGILLQIHIQGSQWLHLLLKQGFFLQGIQISWFQRVYFKVGVIFSFQDMEENFKQVRLQDRQYQKILEKKHNTKVSVLIVVFFSVLTSVHFKWLYYHGSSGNQVIWESVKSAGLLFVKSLYEKTESLRK